MHYYPTPHYSRNVAKKKKLFRKRRGLRAIGPQVMEPNKKYSIHSLIGFKIYRGWPRDEIYLRRSNRKRSEIK